MESMFRGAAWALIERDLRNLSSGEPGVCLRALEYRRRGYLSVRLRISIGRWSKVAGDSGSACLAGEDVDWSFWSVSSTLSKMSPPLTLLVPSVPVMSLASGTLGMVGDCMVLALIREGDAGFVFGDSSLVKLRDICKALGLRASVDDGVGIL